MLKLTGAVVVLLACAGFLHSWQSSWKSRIWELEQLCRLYRSARHAMEEERIHIPDFVRRYRCQECPKESATNAMLEYLESFLKEHSYSTGEEAFRQACLQTREAWYLSGEEWEALLHSGGSFFGRNLAENAQGLLLCEEKMKAFCQRAGQEYREKNKVWTPVGMLLGVMIVVVLL